MRAVLVAVCVLLLGACTKDPGGTSTVKTTAHTPTSDYERRLAATTAKYPFQPWPGVARLTVTRIFDQLIADLIAAGEGASEAQKLACFRRAVSALNDLDRKDRSAIETGEAEQLIEIGNHIAVAAGLQPQKYGDGEGPISAGRNW